MITKNNRTQFSIISASFGDFLLKYDISHHYSLNLHPIAREQAPDIS